MARPLPPDPDRLVACSECVLARWVSSSRGRCLEKVAEVEADVGKKLGKYPQIVFMTRKKFVKMVLTGRKLQPAGCARGVLREAE